jgi:hypothetical protein
MSEANIRIISRTAMYLACLFMATRIALKTLSLPQLVAQALDVAQLLSGVAAGLSALLFFILWIPLLFRRRKKPPA